VRNYFAVEDKNGHRFWLFRRDDGTWHREDLSWFLHGFFWRHGVSEWSNLRPATAEEIAESLAFGLRFNGRKRVHHADPLMARITAEHLVRHLEQSGFVLMKQPAGTAPSTTEHHRR
jgi:hypothetical protein